jgi:zinc D-Ala-D-Ala dipeptidase
MKKNIPAIYGLLLCLLLCLSTLTACGTQGDQNIVEKRTVEFSRFYDQEGDRFSLDGYEPGSTRDQLEKVDGFLQNEPVVIKGLAANVTYAFSNEKLYQATVEVASAQMSQRQWDAAASAIYDGLRTTLDPYGDLKTYRTGSFASPDGMMAIWYAEGAETMSMLTFDARPPVGGDANNNTQGNRAAPSITVSITVDLPGSGFGSAFATASYLSHFPPADDEMVDAAQWIPGVYVDLMYAGSDNFTGQVIYDFHTAYLRYGTVKKLIEVQKKLHRQGYSLKICDAFRPVSAQFKLWEIVPDPNFVADPYHGYSTHSRGNTVDLDLVTIDGAYVEMPTPVDTFSPLADRDYSDVGDEAKTNALILQNAMVDAGFRTSSMEWWHYYDTVSYPVAKDFDPSK